MRENTLLKAKNLKNQNNKQEELIILVTKKLVMKNRISFHLNPLIVRMKSSNQIYPQADKIRIIKKHMSPNRKKLQNNYKLAKLIK